MQKAKTPNSRKKNVQGLTENCFWLWDFSSEAQGSVVYLFINITPRSTQIQSDLE